MRAWRKNRSCIELADGKTELEAPRVPQRELHCITDCGAKGFPMHLWLFTLGGAFGSYSTDKFAHDVVNSVKRAGTRTGVGLLILEWGLVANYRKTPFGSDDAFHKCSATAHNLISLIRSLDFDFLLFDSFYPDMAKAFGLWEQDMLTEQRMAAVLDMCEDNVQYLGEVVKVNRWFAIWDSVNDRLGRLGPFMAMVLIWMGMNGDWAEQAADILHFYTSQNSTGNFSTLPSGSAIIPMRSVKESGDVFRRLRSAANGNEHTVATILCNRLGYRVMVLLASLVAPARRRHGEAMVAAETPWGASNWRVHEANGGWRVELSELVYCATDEAKLTEGGWLGASEAVSASAHIMELEQDVAHVGHNFIMELLGSRILFHSIVEIGFPWCFAALLNTHDAPLRHRLNVLKAWWLCLQTLEEESQTNVRARRFRLRLVFPLWRWVMWVFVVLSEFNFEEVLGCSRPSFVESCRAASRPGSLLPATCFPSLPALPKFPRWDQPPDPKVSAAPPSEARW